MDHPKEIIKQLVGQGKSEKALKNFINWAKQNCPDLENDLQTLKASYSKGKRDFNMGLATAADWNALNARTAAAILDMIEACEESHAGASPQEQNPAKGKRVFISYNHKDAQVAAKINEYLTQQGLQVVIDSQNMAAGRHIQDFIEESVNTTDVTLSLVSNNSLLSGWVAMETVNTFYLSRSNPNKQFIACYIDDEFFAPEFRLQATQQIDERIARLDNLMEEYRHQKMDTNDLNSEKSRLYELRNHLGRILDHLRSSLCIDISNDHFDKGMQAVIKTIHNK